MPNGHVLFLLTESSLHAGEGPEPREGVDLPIQREPSSSYPVVRGSSLRGALRQHSRLRQLPTLELFGSEGGEQDPAPGLLGVGDAHLLLFPVRTLTGLFAWVTTPRLLQTLDRTLKKADPKDGLPVLPDATRQILVNRGSRLLREGRVSLEETVFAAVESTEADRLSEWFVAHTIPRGPGYGLLGKLASTGLAVVPDVIFQNLLPLVIPVIPRIRLDPETGTVKQGALWSTELLPSETLLGAFLSNEAEGASERKVVERFRESVASTWLQVGGCKSIGMGVVSPTWR